MARIFISMSGEGRGHATRVRAVVGALAGEHELVLYAPGDAGTFLGPLYAGTAVEVRPLRGLRFAYDDRHRLRYGRTLAEVLAYLRALPRMLDDLSGVLQREKPDLVITDFEPALARAARRCGVPFVSLNHQHFLRTYDLSGLSRRLRWHAAYMGWVVGRYYSGQQETIVSSFYFPPLRPGVGRVTQVGVLLRPEVVAAATGRGDFLVAYWRRFVDERVLAALEASGLEVRVYGLGTRPARGRVTFHAVSERGFLGDLAGCAALVSTAGNQLVGEALFLGKPVLALPETNNFEQEINGHFLQQSGAGQTVAMAAFDVGTLRRFVDRLEVYRSRMDPERMNGLPATLAVIRRHLPPSSARAAARPVAGAARLLPA